MEGNSAAVRPGGSAVSDRPQHGALGHRGGYLGTFNLLEYSIRDAFFRFRPIAAVDDSIVIVTIDEADIQAAGDWPITDETLAALLREISAQEPIVIGVNLYRDLPEEPGHAELLSLFRTTPEIIGIEKITGNRVAPPPVLRETNRVAIADFLIDQDGTIRRALLSAQDPQADNVPKFGLAAEVALRYLAHQGIHPVPDPDHPGNLTLGQGAFSPMGDREAGYSDLAGYQVLINWLGPANRYQQVPMQAILAGDFPAELLRDRIVLVGSTAASVNDFYDTPYNYAWTSAARAPMAGVFIHANIASQIIQTAPKAGPLCEDGRLPRKEPGSCSGP
ncbi:MAG: CHASE2 domain-containing protein [Leptolyngbya sp. RL_3_1]|nr:CHASE2 domain-containing protein [Leptolyngbya sp. RL_3_1]